MNIKKISVLVLALIMSTCLLMGCADSDKTKNNQYSIVCTIFPEYDWVKEIIGEDSSIQDKYELTLLLDSGADLHSYQPTAEDILTISTCDLFIYVGGESDSWVKDALKESTNKNRKVINLMEVLGERAKEEEIIEGMESEEEEEDSDEEEMEYDEHVWLSLKNAAIFVNTISAVIQEMDSENKDIYAKNSEAYLGKLENLDTEYLNMIKSADKDTIVFGDRFPFRYMVDDYHLNYYAAFVGCSAETEASFKTVIFLSGKLDEIDLKHIIVTESSDKKLAQTIIDNTKSKKQNILVLDSMQSATQNEIRKGITYLSIMKSNLEVLEEALN